ncbi:MULTISPECIES: hypothetical protein [unclassified Variovorax]|uniref:hypothetical protein n=1 Tax=unclassified Variovorax TaxID=663243 RepID=UPI001BD662E3|nr:MULTISPECIES: hypothetical protein [unclassified Variovorax]
MTVDEPILERVLRERRFDERTAEIARRLFLGNERPQKLAMEYCLLDKRIYAIRAEVVKHVKGYALPAGWSEVTLRGPVDAVKAAHALFRKRMREHEEASRD